MNTFFCPECGYGNPYSLYKPKSCAKCGNSFGNTVVAAAPAQKTFTKVEPPKIIGNNNNSIVKNNNFSDIDLGINIEFPQLVGQTLQSALANPSAPLPALKTPKGPKKSRKQILDEFQQESSSKVTEID